MKLKYYLNNTVLFICIVFIILISCVFISYGAVLQSSNTASLASVSISSHKIFKCQSATISANYLDYSDIISLSAILTNNKNTDIETVSMSHLGNGQYSGTFGNNPNLEYGNRSISFLVHTASGDYINQSNAYLFVYADECQGTNIQGWQNTSHRNGFGNYTQKLFTSEYGLIDFATYPFIQYFGNIIYVIFLFIIGGILYLKTQSVATPILLTFIMIAAAVGGGYIDIPFKMPLLMLMSVGLAAILYRLFKTV